MTLGFDPSEFIHEQYVANRETKDLGVGSNAKRVIIVDGSGNSLGGFNLPTYDYVSRGINSATETWTFKSGGSGGTTVATIVVVYTDATLADILTVTKT